MNDTQEWEYNISSFSFFGEDEGDKKKKISFSQE